MFRNQECFGVPEPAPSEIYLTGTPGAGSTNTAVLYLPTVSRNTAHADLQLNNSPVYGTIITVGSSGIYAISLKGGYSGVGGVVPLVTLNSPITSSTVAHTDSSVIAAVEADNYSASANVTLFLQKGDVIKFTWSSGGSLGNINIAASARIIRLA